MRRLLAVIAATAVFGIAGAASAHPEPDGQYGSGQQYNGGGDDDADWNNGGDSYSEFQQEYDHITQNIQHGVSDGSYSRYQAAQYYRTLQFIRRIAYQNEQNGDYNSDWVQSRLDRLHTTMHRTHDRGHDRQDRERYGNPGGYNYYNR